MIALRYAVVIVIFWCGGVAVSQQPARLRPEMPSQATRTRLAKYRVDFRVVITAPPNTRQLRVWLPLPPSDEYQRVSDRQIETFPRPVQPAIGSEPVFGNTFAYFEFDSPDGAREIIHRFTAEIYEANWDVDYDNVKRPARWPESFARFQASDPRAENSRELSLALEQIKRDQLTSSQQLVEAIRWVDANLTYDPIQASFSANPQHALVYRRGHCSDYHGLCGAFAREVGYPSRVLYGLQMFDKASPSHCKLELFLPPYGWVTYDLSETQKAEIKAAADESMSPPLRQLHVSALRERAMRGFRENSWLLVTRGVNYQLAPPGSSPVSIIRTIYAEADGVALAERDYSHPDPANDAWVTMHQVDEIGDASRRYADVDVESDLKKP